MPGELLQAVCAPVGAKGNDDDDECRRRGRRKRN